MKRIDWWIGAVVSALLVVNAPAQVVFSFETEDLHGYADDGIGGWQVFRSTFGVTHGNYSMAVQWPSDSGGFRWLTGDGNRDALLPYLQISKKLLRQHGYHPRRCEQ